MKNSISVVIPTYNRENFIERATRSVLEATSPEDEVLVIDDGSIDNTSAVVQQFGDSIRYVRIENSGPGAARNVGMRIARNPLVAFLDSDDRWVSDKLELQRTVMEEFPFLVFCFGNMFATFRGGKIEHDLLRYHRHNHRIGSDLAPLLTDALGTGIPYSSFAPLPEGRADFEVYIGDLYPVVMEAHYVHSNTVLNSKRTSGTGSFLPRRYSHYGGL